MFGQSVYLEQTKHVSRSNCVLCEGCQAELSVSGGDTQQSRSKFALFNFPQAGAADKGPFCVSGARPRPNMRSGAASWSCCDSRCRCCRTKNGAGWWRKSSSSQGSTRYSSKLGNITSSAQRLISCLLLRQAKGSAALSNERNS